jgi:hypothetical protein
LTENSDTPDKSKERGLSKELSTETANDGQGQNEAKQYQQCKLQVTLDEKGTIKVLAMDENCLRIFEELPPVRRQFWRRRLTPELRGKTEHAEESEESKDGRQTT